MNVVALFVLAASGVAPTAAVAAYPQVAAFTRFHGTPSLDDAAAGRLLVGELNCTGCHKAEIALGEHLPSKRAPILSGVGDRVRPEFVRALLSDPQHAKPGTTMPDALAGLPAAEKKHAVEALTHFLASAATEAQRDRFVDKEAVKRGEQVFHDVGCAACHGSRKSGVEPLPFAVPLGDPAAKYTVTSLAEFLFDPIQVRPTGRMPKLNLTEDEARDVASYFLKDVPGDPNVTFAYYEGRWEKLPDFAKLTPQETGTTTGFDITLGKKNGVAYRFEGYLHLDGDVNNEFRLTSDDGAKLFVDDVLLIDNDGTHPASEKQVRSILKKGVHQVRVEWFDAGGDAVLKVEMFRPKKPPQNLASLLTLTAEPPAVDPEAFRLDEKLVDEGRKLFTSTGCAACHEMKIGDERLASTLIANPLHELSAERGCAAAAPSARAPNYSLTAAQRQALAAAQAWVAETRIERRPPPPPTAAARTKHLLAAFNCYACHRRDGVGGVDTAPGLDLDDDGIPDVDPQAERMASLFHSTVPEMGDEGRLPPRLDGVGAKLSDKYLKKLFTNGADDRPYMKTVMPDFGGTNVGRLAGLFQELDPPHVVAMPTFAEPDYRVKADGRMLVGTKGFSCVKCHNFNNEKAEGIPGIDITILAARLRPEWFVKYVRDPQQIRPGTRMPTVFPSGKSPLPELFGGDVDKQIVSIWKYLEDGTKAAVPVGVGGEPIELVAESEPYVYRNFIDGAGPRAIGIGYPEKANLAFDANDLRPAIIWHGAFIDAAKHWSSRGAGWQPPLGDDVVRLATGPTFARLGDAAAEWPKQTAKELGYHFRGYRLDDARRPTFLYDLGDATVSDLFVPEKTARQPMFRRTLNVSAASSTATDGLWFRAAAARTIKPADDGTFVIDDLWRVRVRNGSAKPIVRSGYNGGQELLLPVTFTDGRAVIEQEFLW